MLPTVSFPAFASHEDVLCANTKSNIISKLKGNYGFKRYTRDGYKCIIEDKEKRYYEKGEIKNFEKIECEWPLFYLYMIIDGMFKSLPEQVTEYEELLKARIYIDQYGGNFPGFIRKSCKQSSFRRSDCSKIFLYPRRLHRTRTALSQHLP